MGNAHAIADATTALQKTIESAIEKNGGLPGVRVLTERPRHPAPDGAGVFLFLYAVKSDSGMALRLSYLLSFFGDEGPLEPQKLLGVVAGALQMNPVLTTATAEESAPLRVMEDILSTDTLTQIWAAFFGPPYLVSIGYTVGPVFVGESRTARVGFPGSAGEV